MVKKLRLCDFTAKALGSIPSQELLIRPYKLHGAATYTHTQTEPMPLKYFLIHVERKQSFSKLLPVESSQLGYAICSCVKMVYYLPIGYSLSVFANCLQSTWSLGRDSFRSLVCSVSPIPVTPVRSVPELPSSSYFKYILLLLV